MSTAPLIPPPDEQAMARVRAVFEWYRAWTKAKDVTDIHDSNVMRDLELVSATNEGRVVFRLRLQKYLSNINGNLHGGAAALVFDMCTMSALGPIAKKGRWENVSYLKGLPIGTEILIDSSVVQAGGTMALVRGEMKSLDGAVVYATCEHHKVNVPPSPEMFEYEVKPRL